MNFLRWVFVTQVAAVIGMAVWLGLALLPVQALWYEPGTVVISDGPEPVVASDRRILRDFLGHYSGIVRTDDLVAVCDGKSGSFTYLAGASDKEVRMPLRTWIGGTCTDAVFAPGRYQAEMCWTVEHPFFVMPPKTTCLLRGFTVPEE